MQVSAYILLAVCAVVHAIPPHYSLMTSNDEDVAHFGVLLDELSEVFTKGESEENIKFISHRCFSNSDSANLFSKVNLFLNN